MPCVYFRIFGVLHSIFASSHHPRETQLPADDTSFYQSPVVVTDGAPHAIVVDLNSTSSVISICQAYRVGIERDVCVWIVQDKMYTIM